MNMNNVEYIESRLLKALGYLFILNMQNEDTNFHLKLVNNISLDPDSKGIKILYAKSGSHVTEFIRLKQLNTALPALQEVLGRENNAKINAFQDKNTKSIYVLTDKKPTVKQIVMVLRLYFTMEYDSFSTPQTDYMNMLDALIQDRADDFNKCFNKLLKHPYLITAEAEKYGSVFKYNRENRLKTVKDTIDMIRNDLFNLETSYVKKQKALRDNLEIYDAISNSEDNINSVAIGKYILDNPYITPTLANKDIIELHYIAPIVSFDPDAAERAKKHRIDNDKRILDIFVNHYDEYELYTECNINIYSNMSISGIKRSTSYRQYIGQPHVDNYACYGNHIGRIEQFAANGDVVGVIDQTTEMVMNMNFYDGPVTDKLLESLKIYNNIRTWKNRKTGEFMSTKEILEVINGEA